MLTFSTAFVLLVVGFSQFCFCDGVKYISLRRWFVAMTGISGRAKKHAIIGVDADDSAATVRRPPREALLFQRGFILYFKVI